MGYGNFYMHCGAAAVAPMDVRETWTPPGTDTHFPVPHSDIIEAVLAEARGGHGYQVVDQAHSLSHEGQRYFGLFKMEAPEGSDYAPVIGLRNSHDMSFSAGLVMGSNVFVCDNLAFSGEVKLARKHTRNITRDLPELVGKAFTALSYVSENQERRIDAYKNSPLSRGDLTEALFDAARHQALTWSLLGKVDAELANPTHEPEEFGVQHNSAWFAFNCCTEVLKTRGRNGANPVWTQRLHNVFDKAVGLERWNADEEIEDAELIVQEAA